MFVYLCEITSLWKGENYRNLIQGLQYFQFPVLSCVGDDAHLCMCV